MGSTVDSNGSYAADFAPRNVTVRTSTVFTPDASLINTNRDLTHKQPHC